MNSEWFNFDKEFSPDTVVNPDKFELLKKNLGLSSRKTESERKLKSWSSVNRVRDTFDLDSAGTGIFTDTNKLWNSMVKHRVRGTRSLIGRHLSDTECDEIFSDMSESTRRLHSRFLRERYDSESEINDSRARKMRLHAQETENSLNCSFDNSFAIPNITNRKGSEDRTWCRKSSCQGNVTFPESSTASVNSDAASERSYGRSISINSEESVCTEKSANCSTVCETLPDGTNKTQFENNETWLTKSMSGSTVCEKKVKDSSVTEKNDDVMCDKSTKRTSYLEKSATGTSLQEESTSERMVSCGKSGTKTVEQKTSSETYKTAYRSPRNTSTFYDDMNSSEHRCSNFPKTGGDDSAGRKRDFKHTHGKTVSEKISKLIDEAVHQDNLFKIPSALETDIDRMTSDFEYLKGHFGSEKRRHGRRRSSGLFSEVGKEDHELNWSKFNEVRAENEALLKENSKLQSIIQDVTAVNKRWQKYNNERRLYVQKLLSTIQDLQEQINLISEKSAFQSSHEGDSNLLYEDIEKLKREFQEHITVLELQLKSHKDDWDAERKEKQKAVHEKEDLQRKVQDLLKEINFLKNTVVVDEKNRKPTFCSSCKRNLDEGAVFPRKEFFQEATPISVSNSFTPKAFRGAVHVPCQMREPSPEECFFSDDYLSKEESNGPRLAYFSNMMNIGENESYFNEKLSECSNFSQIKKTSGDTIVVEDENGLRLSITEQFPSKDSHLKSILKKADKKMKLLPKSFSEQTEIKNDGKSCGKNRKSSADGRKLNSEDFAVQCSSGAFERESPLPNTITDFLKVEADTRSKSEPNTRSNSSENLKPLRESSSWNNQCPTADAGVSFSDPICSECDPSFSPSVAAKYLKHYEPHSTEGNHF